MPATLPLPAVPATYAANPTACPAETAPAQAARWRQALRPARWIGPLCLLLAFANEPRPWLHPADFAISFAYSLTYFVGLSLVNNYTTDVLNRFIGWDKQPLRRFLLTLGLSLVASLVVIVLITESFSVLLWHQPLGAGVRHNLAGQLLFPLMMTVLVSLFMHSRSFLLSWHEATLKAERLEKESAVARLDSLRRQVDPHFLFNSLNALTSLVEEEPQRAVRFIRQLSSVYRYVLDSQSQELVPLAEELAFAEAYVFLQKTRLGDALVAEMPALTGPEVESRHQEPKNGASQTRNLYLPPLALQLLLENALKHNTAYQADPLRLTVTLDLVAATLTVRNTLRPRRLAPDETSGRGLENLRARYAFLTPRPLAAGPAGSEFVVTLPLLVVGE